MTGIYAGSKITLEERNGYFHGSVKMCLDFTCALTAWRH